MIRHIVRVVRVDRMEKPPSTRGPHPVAREAKTAEVKINQWDEGLVRGIVCLVEVPKGSPVSRTRKTPDFHQKLKPC